jgi:ubiquinol-cytochrome c reductase cytochrome c1 subunit
VIAMMSKVMIRSLHPGLAAAAGLIAFLFLGAASAAGGGGGLHDAANNDISNLPSLQRGAGNFVNYCSGCHSAKYVRYNQLARDLQMSEDQVVKNLMFAATKPTETMEIAMRPEDAQRWFGLMPPDLSLIARSRGPDYLYNFLRSFYLDPARFTGVNNLMLPGASMPHVLAELQGTQQAIFREAEVNGTVQHVFDRFEPVTPGTMTSAEYDEFVRDTVNFLEYIGEPTKQKRQSLGILVMVFLVVFLVLAYLLKREVWRDVR